MTSSPTTRGLGRAEDVRFRIIFEQSPVSTQIFAPNGDTIAVNRAWEHLWGVTLDQIGPYNILQDHQLVEKGVMPYIRQGFAGEATDVPAIKYVPEQTIPGTGAVSHRWVRAFIYPVKDEDGTVREVVLTHEDITEQKRAQEALRESEERFRAMFEGAPIGISLLDAEGRYLAVNPARLQMLGYSEEELIGQHFRDVTLEEDLDHDREVNERARGRGDERFQLEKRFVRADGTVAWTRMTVSMVADSAGKPQYFIALAEDITARKRAEEERARLLELERAARRQIEQLAAEREAVLGQVTDGIIIADPDGRITFVNDAARALHGVAELGVSVEKYSDTYHLYTMDGQPYPPEALTLSRAVLKGETVVNDKLRVRRPDGTEVVTEASATPVIGPDGKRLGAVLSLRDITAQYTLERQKDEFLSSVAHDLRTPLTSIKGRIQLLQRRGERESLSPDQLRDELGKIDANVTRMIGLISELLDVANIQIGRPVNLVLQPVDLVALTQDVVHEHQQATQEHTVRFTAGPSRLVVPCDAGRIERVLGNLISNAMKYSPRGGEIAVEVTESDGDGASWVVVTVQDHGIGIPAADLPYIFERFHRARNVAGRIPGTGIGLAVAREIVVQHGGNISVTSQEGKGTTFTVRLPTS